MSDTADRKVKVKVHTTGVAGGRHLEKGTVMHLPEALAKEAVSLRIANFIDAAPEGLPVALQENTVSPLAAARPPGRKTKKADKSNEGEPGAQAGSDTRTPLPPDFPARDDLAQLEINDYEALSAALGYLPDVVGAKDVEAIQARLEQEGRLEVAPSR